MRNPSEDTVRRLLSLTTATAVAAGLLAGAVAGASPSDARPVSVARLALKGFSHVAVDRDHGQIFFSQGAAGGVLITNNHGQTLQQATSLTGATDLELDPSHAAVWAALPTGHAIGSIDTATLAATTHTLTTECPTQLAPVGSDVWFVNACSGQTPELEAFDPQTTDVTDVLALTASAVVATDGTSRIYVAHPGSTSGQYVVDAYDATSTPSASLAVENAHVPGQVPRQLTISADGTRLASSRGQLLDTTDLGVIQAWTPPKGERGVAFDSTGLLGIGAKVSVTAYQEGKPADYDSVPVTSVTPEPLGLWFGAVSTLDFVGATKTRWFLMRVTFVPHPSMTVTVDHRRVTYGQPVNVTVHTEGIPDGALVILLAKHQGAEVSRRVRGHVQGGLVHFTSYPVYENQTLEVAYDQQQRPRHVAVYVPIEVVLHATDVPHHYLRKQHGVYLFRAGRNAWFRTHFVRWFPGACVTWIVNDRVRGQWQPYARVRGCPLIPSSGVNRIYLPGKLAVPNVRFRAYVDIWQSQDTYQHRHRSGGPVAHAKTVNFSFVK